ncbi:MAG: hypothetical protein WAO55_13475 [Candidatus Manganitrophaceae bacterium]
MQSIPLMSAKAGMKLARGVRNPNHPEGMPICGEGTVVTERILERLSEMGVQSIVVEGHPVRFEGEETLEQQLAALERRFKRVAGDAWMERIKEIHRRRIVREREG